MNQYFYHNFPRSTKSSKEECERGVATLESILKNGLLLTPEQYELTEKRTGNKEKRVTIRQVSSSFTLLNRRELKRHSNLFGTFSLEFNTQTLREMGIMPVFYLPSEIGHNLSQISAVFMNRISDIQNLLDNLNDINKHARNGNGMDYIAAEDKTHTYKLDLTFNQISNFINFLCSKGDNIENLRNSLRVISNLFYPTENKKYTKEFGYYAQREWRIFSGLSFDGQRLTSQLNTSQKNEIIRINPSFFLKEIKGQEGIVKRIEVCELMNSFQGKNIYEVINRIYIPEYALKKINGDLLNHIQKKVKILA